GFQLLADRIAGTIERPKGVEALAGHAAALEAALEHLGAATRAAWQGDDPQRSLANATPYLQAFGHVVLAWIWLDVALCAQARLDEAAGGGASDASNAAFLRGKLAACAYFFRYELPRIGAWLKVVETQDDTCLTMTDDWF
ncbi:MAG: acyl-CoA dehydrogenase C-terminal domain-containing protein, partial [Burkholderiaceae bacterium]|nr:acyl-CoA dehydrogenase C-terminal domain-containing protein [Burkholderiaceae bacterium]